MRNFLRRKSFDRLIRVLTHSVPHVLVWIALVFLMISSFAEFTQSADFQTVATSFLSAIALVLTLASVTFTYATTKSKEDRDQDTLINAGEMFLYASLIILITLLIGWLVFQLNHIFVGFSWGVYIKFVLGLILILAELLLIFAADNLSRGIRILEKNLSDKIREHY